MAALMNNRVTKTHKLSIKCRLASPANHLQKCRVLVTRLTLIILHRDQVLVEGGGRRQYVCQDATAMVILHQFMSSYRGQTGRRSMEGEVWTPSSRDAWCTPLSVLKLCCAAWLAGLAQAGCRSPGLAFTPSPGQPPAHTHTHAHTP